MRFSRVVLLVLTALLFLPGGARGEDQEEAAPPPATQEKPATDEIVVPARTLIPLALKNTINSRTAFVGQAVYCETIYPITVGNRIVIPVGSYVKGSVTQVKRPGRVKGRAEMGLRFESLTLPNGTTRWLRATLSSYAGNADHGFRRDEGRVEGEATKSEDAETIARRGTHGAIIGAVAGRSAKGAGIGAAAGGVGGLIQVLATRGKDIVLMPGTNLELELSVPLTFEKDEIDPPSRYDAGPTVPRRDY